MIRKIKKKHLIALFILVAMIAGIATSVIMMSSDSNDNTANATEYAGIPSSGGGGGGIWSSPAYKLAYGSNPKGGNGSEADQVIARLIQTKGGNFQCQGGVVWYAYYRGGPTHPAVVLATGGWVTMNPSLGGNWDGGHVGGGHPWWNDYYNNYLVPHFGAGNSGWVAGCRLEPSNSYGWYDTTETAYDLASKSTVNRKQLDTCFIQFDNSATGTDGYPKTVAGYSKENSPSDGHIADGGNVVVTPYGELVDSLESSKYAHGAGSKDETNKNYNELTSAVEAACKRTDNTTTSITIPTNHELSTALAKGGIEKIMKTGKKQSISYPTAENKWYWRKVTRTIRHYRDCGGRDAINVDGRYITCMQGQHKKSDDPVTGWHPEGWQSDDGSHRQHSGKLLSYYCYDTGRQTSGAEYSTGCWNNVKSQTTVKYNAISFFPILHYYILNILCNKTDYETYRSYYAEFGFTGGYTEHKQDSTNRFQASMQSPIYYDNGTTVTGRGEFPRMAEFLASKGKLSGWHYAGTDDHSIMKLYSNYSGEKDPLYSKECPFDCVPEGTSNAAIAGNVGNGTNNKYDPALNRQGVKESPTDTKGKLQDESKVSADMTFFRNNYWNTFRVDAWTPKSQESLIYDGNLAKRTIITRNEDATPWKKTNGASLQGKAQGASSYVDVLNPNMTSTKQVSTQTSPSAAEIGVYGNSSGTSEGALTAIMNGQVNDYRIKAPWASDAQMPIRLNIRYEYDVKNSATVVAGFEGTGANGGLPALTTVHATSDGKCDATVTGNYKNTDDKNYQYTGAGTTDEIDRKLDGSDEFARAVLIQFVRATAE